MKGMFRFLFEPMRPIRFLTLFLIAFALLTGIVLFLIRPGNLQAGDFMLIAWHPGRELLETGSVYADYPYPLWTVVVMLPLVVWEPQTAMSLMLFVNVALLAAGIATLVPLFNWEVTPALFIAMIVIAGLFPPVLTSLWIGQLTIFSFFVLALTLHGFLHKRWVLLGVALGLSFIKPHVMLLLTGILLAWALWNRRWQIWVGFLGVLGVLTVISLPFISTPAQIIGGGINSHLSTFLGQTSTIWGVMLGVGLPVQAPLIVAIALLLWLGWISLPFIFGAEISAGRALFIFSAAMMINLIAVPYSWMHNLALLVLPITYCLSIIYRIKGWAQVAGGLAILFITHPLMVILFFTLGTYGAPQAFQGIPALLLLPVMAVVENKTRSLRGMND